MGAKLSTHRVPPHAVPDRGEPSRGPASRSEVPRTLLPAYTQPHLYCANSASHNVPWQRPEEPPPPPGVDGLGTHTRSPLVDGAGTTPLSGRSLHPILPANSPPGLPKGIPTSSAVTTEVSAPPVPPRPAPSAQWPGALTGKTMFPSSLRRRPAGPGTALPAEHRPPSEEPSPRGCMDPGGTDTLRGGGGGAHAVPRGSGTPGARGCCGRGATPPVGRLRRYRVRASERGAVCAQGPPRVHPRHSPSAEGGSAKAPPPNNATRPRRRRRLTPPHPPRRPRAAGAQEPVWAANPR